MNTNSSDDVNNPPHKMDEGALLNTLVLGPPHEPKTDEICVDLVGSTPTEETNILWIDLTDPPDVVLNRWHNQSEDLSLEQSALITADEVTRSTKSSPRFLNQPNANAPAIEVISEPGNLTDLGIAMTNTLSEWSENENRTTICFRSITSLLEYAELNRVFKFLHVMTQVVKADGAKAHFHMDPSAHDSESVHTIKTLFGNIVDTRSEQVSHTNKETSVVNTAIDPDPKSADNAVLQGQRGPERFHTQYDENESPSYAITRAIANTKGVSQEKLQPPLHDRVDPDALDSMFTPTRGSNIDSVRVEFMFEEYLVIVDSKTVTVRGPEHCTD